MIEIELVKKFNQVSLTCYCDAQKQLHQLKICRNVVKFRESCKPVA